MKRKILHFTLAFGLLAAAGTAIYFYLPQATSTTSSDNILPFDDARDTQAILDIFKEDMYWLSANPHCNPEFKLKNRTPDNNDTRYFGKLIIKVAYEQQKLAGFVAYYMKNFFIGAVLFLDVKPEFRGKGYAQQLMKHAIEDMKSQGATIITLVTRTSNTAAQKLYQRLGFIKSFEEEDQGFVYFELRT